MNKVEFEPYSNEVSFEKYSNYVSLELIRIESDFYFIPHAADFPKERET